MASNNALNQTSPNFTVNQITISNAPVVGTDGTNKAYVDMIAAGFNFKNSTVAGTTGALTATYANGAAGVGATLTNAGAMAAFSVDGVSPALNDRILVKDQGSTFENGIYTLTTVGSGAVNWVLTRATDYDTPAEINPGDIVAVQEGTVNATTLWLQTEVVVTIGTDPILFSQFFSGGIHTILGNAGSATASSGAVTISGGNNITTTGAASTLSVAVTGTTNHNVQVGNASGSLSSVAPSATSGVPLISQGAAADPAFGTAVVAGGGTGATSFTAYAVVCGGTTSTNPLQSIAGVGTSGQVLTSNGAAMLPTFQSLSGLAVTSITGDTGGPQTGAITLTGGTTGASFGGAAGTITMTFAGITANNGTISLSTDASAATVNVGTGAAVKTSTFGSTNSTSSTTLQSGSGALNVTSTGGALTINSGTGALGVSTDASATTVNLATGAAVKTTTLGSTNSTSTTTVQSGSGALNVTATGGALTINSGTGTLSVSSDASATTVNLATGGAAKVVTLGSTSGASSLALKTGTADFSLASATGTIMSALDTGEITYPLQPAFLAFVSTTDSNVTGAGAVFTLGSGNALSEVFDQNGDFVTTGTFTAPVTGRYRLEFHTTVTGTTIATLLLLIINTSNRSYQMQTGRPANNQNFGGTLSSLCDMDSGDTATFAIQVSGEAADTDDIFGDGGTLFTSVSGNLVC